MCKNTTRILILLLYALSASLRVESQTMPTLLSETFDNENGWEKVSDFVHLAKLVDGDYFIRNRHNETWFITDKLVKFDQDEDFSIEATIQKKAGINQDGFGISWGRKDGHNAYSFTISSNGSFEIGKWNEDRWMYLARKKTDLIKKGRKENKLRVHKKDDTYFFYINDNLVEKKKYEGLPGTKVGFIIYNRISIAIKNLVIKGTPTVKQMSSISNARRGGSSKKDTLSTSEIRTPVKPISTLNAKPLIKPSKKIETTKFTKNREIGIESDGRFIVSTVNLLDKPSRSGSFTVGNSNGKLERGEAVKIELSFINNGNGISNEELIIELLSNNGGYMLVNPENKFKIQQLMQSDVFSISFVVFVAKKYTHDTIRLKLFLSESSEGEIKLTVPVY